MVKIERPNVDSVNQQIKDCLQGPDPKASSIGWLMGEMYRTVCEYYENVINRYIDDQLKQIS